jgi:hypothetical protein
MTHGFLFAAGSLAMLSTSFGAADAGQSIDLAGTMACVNDKWDEKEPEKGHKLVDYGGRCVVIPNDTREPMYVEDCTGKYEYMKDGTWKGAGDCTTTFKSGDTLAGTWEEGSQLQDFPFTYTGGTGKYKGAVGGGTYKTEELTTTLYGGRKSGKLQLP